MQFVNDNKYIFVIGMEDKIMSGIYYYSLIIYVDYVVVYNLYCVLCVYFFQEWIIIYNYLYKIFFQVL